MLREGGTRIVFVDQVDAFDRPDLFSMLPNGTDARPLVTDQVSGGSINPAFLRRTK